MIIEKNHGSSSGEVPPLVLEEGRRVISGWTMIIGTVIFFAIVLSNNFSNRLDSIIPFGRFLWVFFIGVFLVYIIKVSGKINKSLKIKNTSISSEYNKHGDSQLYNSTTKTGDLKIFDSNNGSIIFLILPFSTFILIFGLLSLHLVFFEEVKEFLIPGNIAVIVGLATAFGFLFNDRRILTETKRRNENIDIAKKRWKLSIYVYILFILLSLVITFFLVKNDMNFVGKGVLTSGNQVIYDGRK